MSGTWASGWLTNDIVTAAEFKKSAGSIYDTTLGASAASVDVTAISSTYAHLLISTYTRSDTAAANTPLLIRFNGDTGANYDYQYAQGSAAVASAAETFAATSLQVGYAEANTAGANLFAMAEIFIPHYAGSSNNKQVASLATSKGGTASGNLAVNIFGGGWRSNAAINQVTLFPSAGNFVSGTRITIYAMGA